MKRVKADYEQPEDDNDHIPAEPDLSEVKAEEVTDDKSKDDSIFPVEYLEPLCGLMFLGALTKEIEYAGHTFLIHTLTEGEILRVGQLVRDYNNSPTEIESRKVYTVAACIDMVDGLPLTESYKAGYDKIYEKAKAVKEWYPASVHEIYLAYIDLEQAAIEVSKALKKS